MLGKQILQSTGFSSETNMSFLFLKSLQEWDERVREWKEKIENAILNANPTHIIKHNMDTINSFKETKWYKDCDNRPKTPDLIEISKG